MPSVARTQALLTPPRLSRRPPNVVCVTCVGFYVDFNLFIVVVAKRRRLENMDDNSDDEVDDGSDVCVENAEFTGTTCHVAKQNTPLDKNRVNKIEC